MKKSPPSELRWLGWGLGRSSFRSTSGIREAEVVAVCRRNEAEMNKLADAFKIAQAVHGVRAGAGRSGYRLRPHQQPDSGSCLDEPGGAARRAST